MCGIAGIINPKRMDVSSKLLEMLDLIQHRGPDASGIAVYGQSDGVNLRVAISQKNKYPELLKCVSEYANIESAPHSESDGPFAMAEMAIVINDENLPKLHAAINSIDGLYVHSLGRGMNVYKDGGLLVNLKGRHRIDTRPATHGMGHVRMATESAEDINAAHPFVSPFYPQLSIVHNGQFTNYFNLRRSLETKGAIFKTLNDSEAASHLIAYFMKQNGGDLKAALEKALEELDGIFCIIAATPTQMGFVKDKMGIKPLLLFEKDGMTLFGSEQIEFTTLFPDVYAEEMEPGEVRVWDL